MNIETNNPAMKIFIILILFLSSCIGKGAKDYKYIETSMRSNLLTTTPKENRAVQIRAKTDSEAYVQSYIYFCISKKVYNEEFQKSGAIAGKPLSFRLLNETSIDISKSVSFLNKQTIEKNIEKRVSTFDFKKHD